MRRQVMIQEQKRSEAFRQERIQAVTKTLYSNKQRKASLERKLRDPSISNKRRSQLQTMMQMLNTEINMLTRELNSLNNQ